MKIGLTVPSGLARHSFGAMGTGVLVVVPTDRLERAAAEVEALFATWEQALSRFRPTSELSALNRSSGRVIVVSELVFEVVSAALEAARATGGLFDPSLLPDLVRIGYDRTFDAVGSPKPSAAAPRGGGGWRRVRLDRSRSTIALPPGVELDLGGIAKGMAVDASLQALAGLGIDAALVSAGGDLAVRGRSPQSRAWPIAVGEDGNEVVELVRGALATSTTARRRWRQGDVGRHHLLDPRTGEPTRSGLLEVSVAAPTCMQAEVAAKAVFVLGPTLAAGFVARHGLAARLVNDDGRRIVLGPWPTRAEAAA